MQPAKATGTSDEIVKRLAIGLKRNKEFQPKRANAGETILANLLDIYVAKYPEAPTAGEINSILKGRSPESLSIEIGRLNKRLNECFRKDRSLWEDQKRLFIPRKIRGGPLAGLQVEPLTSIMDPTLKFWFHQCVRFRPTGDGTQSFIVFSEPLFFFSNTMRGYFRFLDVNHDGPFEPGVAGELTERAKRQLRKIVDHKERRASRSKDPGIGAILEFIERLDIVPVRTYIPAGDSYGAIAIRRWFRDAAKEVLDYREVLKVSFVDRTQSNLIILASRCSSPLLASFQEETPQLKLRLTEAGIRLNNKDLDDEIGDQGVRLARVIVTNWVMDTENVHTVIASNNSRAIGAVAKLLVNDEALRSVADAIVASDGSIPRRFQLAFEVNLQVHESHANDPILLPQLEGKPIVYE